MPLILGSTNATVTTPPIFNVANYGALGDNSHDDTSAIQTAMNALKASVNAASGSMGGQTLYFPPGYYKVTSTLDFKSLAEVRILGGSGRGAWGRLAADANPPVVLAITHGNASTADGVSLGGCTGIVWDGVSVVTRGSGYAGIALNWDSLTQGDLFGNRIQNCVIRGLSGCAYLMSLDGQIEFSADNVTFADGVTGSQVRGFNASTGASKWSNANSFRSCSFIGPRVYSIHNFGPQTTFLDCTFENSTAGVAAPIRLDNVGQPGIDSFSFTGCGFWDVTSGATPWIQSTVATYGMVFNGCHFDCPPTGPTFDLSTHTGLVIQGCFFNSPGGGTPNIFKPAQNITAAVMQGCYVKSPVVDNHASVFV